MSVRNQHNDPSAAEQSASEVVRAEAIVEHLQQYVDAMRQLDAEWQARTASHAAAFKQNLDVTLTSARLELEQVKQRLTIARAALDRMQRLAARGNASVAAADEAQALVAELELQRVERERNIAELEVRRAAAEKGVFITVDGNDPDWDDRSRDELRRDLARGVAELAEAQATLADARHVAASDASALERTSVAAVTAPPGSLIWSVIVGAGTAVNIGEPDRRVARLLGDAGRRARERHRGGSAAAGHGGGGGAGGRAANPAGHHPAHPRLGRHARAGRSRGPGEGPLRRPGSGPVALEPTPDDIATCPIGHSAFVEFPQVDVIDMLRARLRL